MKKVILFGAALAALATFNSCSSEDDIVAQEPTPVQEEPAVVKGIPFSVSAFSNDDTRAIRYGSDGSGVEVNGDEAGFVNCFKLYAIQSGQSTPWIDQYVFARSANTDTWAPARNNEASNISTVNITWPDNTATAGSTFYAVTDNAIANESGNPMEGVTANFTLGQLTYELPVTAEPVDVSRGAIGTDYEDYSGWPKPTNAVADGAIENFYAMDADAMKDLMVANVVTEAGNTDKVILPFQHALAGLSLKVKFHSADWASNAKPGSFRIYGVRVHGLKTSGTLNLSTMEWSNLEGNYPYYKGWGVEETGALDAEQLSKGVYVEAENEGIAVKHDLVLKGEWFVIPQTTTAASIEGEAGKLPTSGTFVEIVGYRADNDSYGMGIYPFAINFEAGHNYSLVIDMTKVRNTAAVDATTHEYNLWFLDNQIGGGARRLYK